VVDYWAPYALSAGNPCSVEENPGVMTSGTVQRGEGPTSAHRGWSDARLVQACVDGDQIAWATLIERYKHLIYSVPFKYRAAPEDAADIFQAVCLELFTALPRLRKIDSLRSWLLTVAAHQCFHWKQRQRKRVDREQELEDADAVADAPLAPEVQAALERDQTVRDTVRQLPPRCQELVRLLFFEETPVAYKDVAARLGLATGSIGFIRGRCLKRLQRLLEDAGL
jgi:RNA polymerase sigma factor (sigma-70 family)